MGTFSDMNISKTEVMDEEERKKAEHEAEEAKRKAEWEAKIQAKRDAEQKQLDALNAMTEDELLAASNKRIEADTEKLTRRNMKECVSEHIRMLCFEDIDFARLTMHPRKSMIHCFQYINRKAYEYIQDELKANGIKLGTGANGYGSDIPDDLCYQWAEEYFRDPNAKEDQTEEEKFVPRPYKSSVKTKKTEKKKPDRAKPKEEETQMLLGEFENGECCA